MKTGVPEIALKGAIFIDKKMQEVYGKHLTPDELSKLNDAIYAICNRARIEIEKP